MEWLCFLILLGVGEKIKLIELFSKRIDCWALWDRKLSSPVRREGIYLPIPGRTGHSTGRFNCGGLVQSSRGVLQTSYSTETPGNSIEAQNELVEDRQIRKLSFFLYIAIPLYLYSIISYQLGVYFFVIIVCCPHQSNQLKGSISQGRTNHLIISLLIQPRSFHFFWYFVRVNGDRLENILFDKDLPCKT